MQCRRRTPTGQSGVLRTRRLGDRRRSGAYALIGDSIAVARAGDTIRVLPGTYAESFEVSKPITIAGVVEPDDDGSLKVRLALAGRVCTALTFAPPSAHLVWTRLLPQPRPKPDPLCSRPPVSHMTVAPGLVHSPSSRLVIATS